MENWDEGTFYPDPSTDTLKDKFSQKYCTQLCVEHTVTVNEQGNNVDVDTPVMGDKWVVFDKNLQKIVMSKYKRNVQEKEKQWNWCQEHKKLLLAAVWSQLDDDTQAQMELSTNYDTHQEDGNIVEFLKLLRNICNGSDNGGLSYQPFKVASALKSLNLFSNQDVSNIHYFTKELKV